MRNEFYMRCIFALRMKRRMAHKFKRRNYTKVKWQLSKGWKQMKIRRNSYLDYVFGSNTRNPGLPLA